MEGRTKKNERKERRKRNPFAAAAASYELSSLK